MIASLTGHVTHVGLESAILDVNGFGMLVRATARTPLKSAHGIDCNLVDLYDRT